MSRVRHERPRGAPPRRHPRGWAVLVLVVLLPLTSAVRDGARAQTGGSADGDQAPQVATDPSFRELLGGLLEGIPDFPAYPGARLVGSAERNRPDERNRGYLVKWTTRDRPARVMAWYEKALPPLGWKYVPSHEGDEEDELEAKVAKAAFVGYLEAETDDDGVTVVVLVLGRR
jgi:hypothetical protein